ncbi:hypothetical protein BC938DRAFT_472185 [Jimgerdemannia flammicorona]|uniref:Uncharacterized protein n=1 Tax=Jimgerdemannia flammicorona TaxID=994334 RepID=A0A433Q6P4_9FUNG|nr:hypothetical protein BC938DRAFT_472185 [Jimgerdemannia flammicorona]
MGGDTWLMILNHLGYLDGTSAMLESLIVFYTHDTISSNPDVIVTEHEAEEATAVATTPTTPTTPTTANPAKPAATADDDDFFSNWDKPKTPTTPAHQTPSRVTNSSLRAKTTVGSSIRSGGASKPMKLGAKKAGITINFEEAEARAKEEQERAAKLGYSNAEEAAEAERKAADEKESQFSSRLVYYEPSATSSGAGKATQQTEDIERMGIGMARLGFGAMPAAGAKPNTSAQGSPSRSVVWGFGYKVGWRFSCVCG